MAKHWKWYALGAMILAQWLVPLLMIKDSQEVLKKGTAFRFECAPVDPNDPFRGKYITLSFTAGTFTTDTSVSFDYGQRVYALLGTDSRGFAKITELQTTRPASGHYLSVPVDYTNTYDDKNEIVLDIPFRRYYLDEFDAPEAERKYQDGAQSKSAYAEVYIYKGEARIKQVVVDGKPLADWLRKE